MATFLPQTIKEPPLPEILRVHQRGFGYLHPTGPISPFGIYDCNYDYIETIGLASCIGVYVRDSSRKVQGLAHVDAGPLGYAKSIHLFLSYLKDQGLTDESFDRIFILGSRQADQRGIDEIFSTFKIRGHAVGDIEVMKSNRPINVIFDKYGQMYDVWEETIQAKKMSDLEREVFFLGTVSHSGLKCENTGEIVDNVFDPIYPGLSRTYESIRQPCCYGIRIPVREMTRGDLDELVDMASAYSLGTPATEIKEPGLTLRDKIKRENISIDLDECEDGKYVTVSTYGYPPSEHRDVMRTVHDIAQRFFIWHRRVSEHSFR